ncbi:Hypothetical protein D9617_11g010320 [Elsinoe fawcettii]|nr:Hypothetical protein D9617_11g010320 [Elsinoe fawcettii]
MAEGILAHPVFSAEYERRLNFARHKAQTVALGRGAIKELDEQGKIEQLMNTYRAGVTEHLSEINNRLRHRRTSVLPPRQPFIGSYVYQFVDGDLGRFDQRFAEILPESFRCQFFEHEERHELMGIDIREYLLINCCISNAKIQLDWDLVPKFMAEMTRWIRRNVDHNTTHFYRQDEDKMGDAAREINDKLLERPNPLFKSAAAELARAQHKAMKDLEMKLEYEPHHWAKYWDTTAPEQDDRLAMYEVIKLVPIAPSLEEFLELLKEVDKTQSERLARDMMITRRPVYEREIGFRRKIRDSLEQGY